MSSTVIAYAALGLAIICEVAGSSFLQKSEQFSKLVPTLAMGILYAAAFFLLSQALKVLTLGVAYAIWAGLGIVLTAMVSTLIFRQAIDLAGMIGIALIVAGVLVMNLFSHSTGH